MPSRARILVVDDDPDVVAVQQLNLELAGHDVVVARDGAQALARLRAAGGFDAVLLDIMMPGIDGWGVLEQVARDDRIDDVPVIVVSAHATSSDRDRAIAAGAREFLPKPFSLASLVELVEEVVASRRVGAGR